MPPLVLLGVLAVASSIGCLTYTAVGRSGRSIAIARRNLTRGLASTTVEVGSLESRGSGSSALLRVITPSPPPVGCAGCSSSPGTPGA